AVSTADDGEPAIGTAAVVNGQGGSSDVASQQTITLVGGMQQNPCGAQAASLFFVNTTDWGTCAVGTSVPAADGAGVGGVGQGGATDVAWQQTITAIGGMQQNQTGAQEPSLFFVYTTD